MKKSKYGFILNTENYRQCVSFYRDTLGLTVLFDKDTDDETLTCFDLNGAYMMVEPGGIAANGPKPAGICPSKLRLNLPEIDTRVSHLRGYGVTVKVKEHDWGRTAEFADPDGNRCAFRSDQGFGD